MYTPHLAFRAKPERLICISAMPIRRLLNYDMAREVGGRLLLRIEDIDAARCRPEYEAAIYEDLRLARHRLAASRCGGRASISTITQLPSPGSRRRGCSIRASRAAARSSALVAERDRAAPGRAIPTACRSIRAARAKCRAAERERRRRERRAVRAAARHGRGGGARRRVDLDRDRRRARTGQTGMVTAAPQRWGDVVLARKDVPTSYHLAVVRRRRPAGRHAMWCAARTCSGRPAFTACCRRCSACRSRATIITAHSRRCAAASCRNRPQATGLRELRAAGATADGYQAHGRTWPLNVLVAGSIC